MSRAVPVAASAADAQAFTGACTLVGYSLRETGAVNPGTVVLRDGTLATDPIRVTDRVTAGTAKAQMLPAVEFATGIFVDRSETGTTELVLYVL